MPGLDWLAAGVDWVDWVEWDQITGSWMERDWRPKTDSSGPQQGTAVSVCKLQVQSPSER